METTQNSSKKKIPRQHDDQDENEKKNSSKVLIAVAVWVFIVAAAAGMLFIFKGHNAAVLNPTSGEVAKKSNLLKQEFSSTDFNEAVLEKKADRGDISGRQASGALSIKTTGFWLWTVAGLPLRLAFFILGVLIYALFIHLTLKIFMVLESNFSKAFQISLYSTLIVIAVLIPARMIRYFTTDPKKIITALVIELFLYFIVILISQHFLLDKFFKTALIKNILIIITALLLSIIFYIIIGFILFTIVKYYFLFRMASSSGGFF